MLEGQEKGDYTIDLVPEVTIGAFAFNVTSDNPEKRKVFADPRFRAAMPVAIDRDEVNHIAFFNLGTPQQYVGFSPAPDFVDPKLLSHMTEYDPDKAKTLLDEVGMKDVDGDSIRELPNGDKLVVNLQFTTKEIAAQLVEVVSEHWVRVGIASLVKEVTPDEYRSAQSANNLDATAGRKGEPLAVSLGSNELWALPFDSYFRVRNGILWALWIDSNGTAGLEPPDYAKQMLADINKLQTTKIGSDEFKMLGNRLVENLVSSLLFIGTVSTPAPVYHRNTLKNFARFKLHASEYHRTYPYRATQWYFADGG